ncbi:acetyl-CoA carboxylase biotin carboxylase subunit [Achromobacter sp. F4_2707]
MNVNKQIRPFHSVLIANRGEIAMRIIHTARKQGYRTVAIYSEADRDSLHVQAADTAVWVGGPFPQESYLNIEAILRAARLSGADAIHPGYGFLAENADFANAVDAAGLVFIGPSGAAIEAMGNKGRAKQLMLEAGMPCIPGYQAPDQTDRTLTQVAEKIGYPIMVKASAGGGGRGMRLVHTQEELPAALASARSEAQQAFGSGELILEKAIRRPRHIEIQILADAHGNCVHLGERDCSIQRRHQKIIEEAPSPVVTPELRERMGAAAIRAARSIQYIGAGTMEFLIDEQEQFYFMEMNTRLQVEHAVTEAITGLDLVEWQLQIAAGNPLPRKQDEIDFQGHAIEARLTAEDTAAGFLPQTGTIDYWRAPDNHQETNAGGSFSSLGVRVDHALCSGQHISPYYDSLLAKVVAHGTTREEARRKLILALERCVALGISTNQHFLTECLKHPEFVEGRNVHTGFLQDYMNTVSQESLKPSKRTIALAAFSLLRQTATCDAERVPSSRIQQGVSVIELSYDSQHWSVRVWPQDGSWNVTVQEMPEPTENTSPSHFQLRDFRRQSKADMAFTVECNGMMETIFTAHHDRNIHVFHDGQSWSFEIASSHKSGQAPQGGGLISAPLTGRVVDVAVKEGDVVSYNQPLVVLESMKMEHTLHAELSGRVLAVHVAPGTQAAKGALLLQIEEQL